MHGYGHCSSCEHEHEEEGLSLTNKVMCIVGIIIAIIAYFIPNETISLVMYIVAYILIGYDIVFKAVKHLFGRDMFDENLIMTIATIGALCIKEYNEAIIVLVLYKIGELLQDKAADSSKEKIEKVLNLKVNETTLKDGSNVNTEDVKVGDIILVKTGDKIPLDAMLESDSSQIDMSALNGESSYVDKVKGEEILSGSINVGPAIYLKVLRTEENSTVSKIIELVENASKNKSKTEKYISRFCKIYTPIVIALAILLPFVLRVDLNEAIYRALNFLVISCPCALIISIPLGFFVGMGVASKKGILSKGSVYLDKLTKIDEIYLDKTGTLTDGKFSVKKVIACSDISEDEVLEYIAITEHKSNHVIAKSIIEKYNKTIDEKRIESHKEISGYGIKAIVDGKSVICGNHKMMENNNIEYTKNTNGGTVIYLSVDGQYKGCVILSDNIKEGAHSLVEKLHRIGVKKVVMLTGDRKYAAQEVAGKLNMDEVYYELLPQDKVRIIDTAKDSGKIVAFVGDGINDSPVIATSDVGIAMGKGSDIAVETADVVLMTDEPEKIVEAISISKRTKKIVNENITLILIVKALFLILSVLGKTNMWMAVFADVGIALITIFNSIRIFNLKN